MTTTKKFIGADQVDSTKILLDNNTFLRVKSAVSGNINLLKVNASDEIEAGAQINLNGYKITGSATGTGATDLIQYGQRGAANGVASLDGAGKVPIAQLPNSIMEFQGVWDASTNTPTLVDATGNIGDVYRANVAGTQNLGSGAQVFVVGDWVMYDSGGIWRKAHAGADAVLSVNGAAGVVTVDAINQLTGDVTASAASGSQSKAATVASIQGTAVSGTTGSGNVVFSASPTFTGTIIAAAISASGALSASNFSGSSSGTNTGNQTITLTGDVTGSGTGSFAATLATVNADVGSVGSSTSIPSITVNAKGLITAASGNAVIAPAGTLSGTTLNATVVTSSLTSVGTIATGVWNGTAITEIRGGTNQTTYATGDLLYASGSNTLTKRTIGATSTVLTVVGGVPAWAAPGAALNGLSAATATNTIDNLNFLQTWNWSSLSSGTAMLMAANAMTTGGILMKLSSSSTAGSLLNLTSTAGSNNVMTLLDVQHAGTDVAKGININMSGSTGNIRTGLGVTVAAANGSIGIDVNMSSGGSSNEGVKVTTNGIGVSANATAFTAAITATTGGAIAFKGSTTSVTSTASIIEGTLSSASATGTGIKITHSGNAGYAGDLIATGGGVKDVLRLQNSVTAANNSAASLLFAANRTGTASTSVASIAGMITDITAGSYKGALVFNTADNAAPAERMRIKNDGSLLFPFTNTAGGTTGNQTINKISGTVNFAATGTTLTVTNSLCTTNSIVFAIARTADATAQVMNVVPANGSFVINLTAAATAETSVGFWLINQ